MTTTAKLAAMLLKETSVDYPPRSAAAEILLLIITGPEGKRSAGFSARVLELMGYIAQEMNERKNVHSACAQSLPGSLRRLTSAPLAPPGAVSGGAPPKS